MKIVIYGATEIGCLLATEFFEDHDITIIDKEENRSDEFNKLDISFVQGNASDIDVLKSASIKEADIFIACTGVDEANIVACLTAKKFGGIRTICFVYILIVWIIHFCFNFIKTNFFNYISIIDFIFLEFF